MAVQDLPAPRSTASRGVSALNDARVRGIVFQIIVVVGIVAFFWWLYSNTVDNLRSRNISSGFGFLEQTAGFDVLASLGRAVFDYSRSSTYADAILVGLVNTLAVAVVGIVVATVLGFVIGVARLSPNWIVSRLAYVYVEFVRNVPLLLQIFIWYAGVLGLFSRDAVSLGPLGVINNRGLYTPEPIPGEGLALTGYTFLLAVALAVAVRFWAVKRQQETGRQFPVVMTALGLIVGLPLLVFLLSGAPLSFSYPEPGRFNIRGGVQVVPEFIGLLLALSIYTAAFIAEIVRAGILAVSHGQTEASYALGLRAGPTLRLVVIPQALRVIIPPLTSQYLNLTKNSSLAVAIAYPDLVSQGGVVLNQSGQAIEVVAIWMVVYLSISLITSAGMNWYNKRVALVER